MATVHTHPGAHDFDFLFGSWHIAHERLKSRLTDSDQWEQFESTGQCWPILDGAGNVDQSRGVWRGKDFEGVSLRVFNPETEQWSIYWVDNVTYILQPPVMGKFVNDVGEFYGDDQHEGTPVLARFIWSGITADSARWEQAFSTDHGETWEVNWIMTFARIQTNDRQGKGSGGLSSASFPCCGRRKSTTTIYVTDGIPLQTGGSIMSVDADVVSLEALGNVPPDYQHEWRVAEPMEPFVLPNAIFKWYHVHRAGVAIPATMDAEARAVIADAMKGGNWTPEYGLNFALIHLGTTQAFLIAGIWRGHQELWERIYYKELASSSPFTRIDTTGEDTPAACVWEMGVIVHERMAWHRYLFSKRTETDKRAWLADTYTGQV